MKISSLFFIVFLFLLSCDQNYYKSYDAGYFDGSYLKESGEEGESEKYTDYGENPFVSVADEATSTFGIDADGGSYSNTRRFLSLGQKPPVASVRIEEYINYFTFDYEDPTNEQVAINTEASVCPWNDAHYLLRIGLKGKSLNEQEIGSSNLVFLIDVSGSMSSPDKLEMLKEGFKMLVDEMDGTDRIGIVTYAGTDKVVLESTYCDEKSKIKRAIDKLNSNGSTAGAKGIITAYEMAVENFIPGGNNRVIVGTDGDFNVGPSSTEELVKLIEEKRESGVYLSVLGVGQGNLNDAMMEQLANNGNGNYEYIDNIDQLKKVFIYEKEKFYTVAKDCKIQVEFNESSIDSFRLIGYENRVLDNEDFENDTVDAGEIGAGQTITAFYELVPKQNPEGAFCNIDFRYKKPNESQSQLLEVPSVSGVVSFTEASENMIFGAAITGFGLLMKESEFKGSLTIDHTIEWAEKVKGLNNYGFKDELIELMEDVRNMD